MNIEKEINTDYLRSIWFEGVKKRIEYRVLYVVEHGEISIKVCGDYRVHWHLLPIYEFAVRMELTSTSKLREELERMCKHVKLTTELRVNSFYSPPKEPKPFTTCEQFITTSKFDISMNASRASIFYGNCA